MEKELKISITQIFKTLLSRKMLFLKVWAVTFALSCLWILPKPRYYTTKVAIAPESADSKSVGDIASLASNFGVNIGSGSSDAIYPQLYPDLFKSTNFLVGLLDIQIKTIDGEVNTDYYTYLEKYQKSAFYTIPFDQFRNWMSSLSGKKEEMIENKSGKRFDPFQLSKKTSDILGLVQKNIKCIYSRTTDVVTINVEDQDPLVCALLADSIKEHLQVFITDYRTKKARVDYEHYKKLTAEAKSQYERARQRYGSYSDRNMDVVLESYRAKQEDLENEMQLKFNIYTAMNTRLETALAKVQENTPVFTTLTNATVPTKPAGPKRMIFVATMMFLSTIFTIAYLFRKELKEWF